jgi:membrane protein implicated in regulation of membrane protease activity
MKLLWLGGAAVMAVAAISAWFAFQRPDFMVGFIAASVAAIYNALSPALFKRKSPEDEKKWRDAGKQGREWNSITDKPREPR